MKPARGSRELLRGLQLALAAFWALDTLLALQPANFTRGLVFNTILGNAENQPQPIDDSLVWASHLLGPYATELNLAIIAVQLAIAAGLLWPRTVKPALGLSIVWALGIWWLGEGFGGIFAGKASLLVGAPGPALLYALLALVAWPIVRTCTAREGDTIAAAGAFGDRGARGLWALLWLGGALLRIVPFWFAPVYALAGDLQLSLDQEPHWLLHINVALSRLASTAGLPLVIAVAATEAVIGIGVFTRHRRSFLAAGIAVSAVYWIFGQQFAGIFTGSATDIAAGPLYILLALTLWPRRYPASGRATARRRLRARKPASAASSRLATRPG
ncbi:MAG: hypothetical protein ACYC91_05175 [Solirubrobacteraceae bacterium]